jgi:zinc transporter ZupT
MNSFVTRSSNRMANTMGNLPASVNGVVNSAVNSAVNRAVNGVATNLPRTHSFYTFLLVVIGAIVLGVVIVYVVRHYGLHRRKHEDREHREHREHREDKEEDRFKKEVWCFVGEDLTGRACVKVPSSASCDAERSYGSRPDCELQTANRLPSGVITNGGTSMIPLAAMGRIL